MRRVGAFLLRRLATAVLTVLVLIAITFVIYWAIPANPAEFLFDPQHLTTARIEQANHFFGLDRPKAEQFADYVAHLARGDLGHAWTYSRIENNNRIVQVPIGPLLYPALFRTLSIILGGAVAVLLLSVPLGAIAGRKVGSLGDRAISLVALVGVCTHPMVLGLIIGSAFGRVHWLPTTGYCPLLGKSTGCNGPASWASHLALPWLTFALLYLALYTRMVRATVDETLREGFVRTARAKGAGELRVLHRHVLPSASLKLLTMVGMEIGTAIGVCVYIEAAFGVNGLGELAVQTMGGATTQIDLPMMLGIVSLLTLVVVVGNLLVDTLYVVLDPRAGLGGERRAKALAGGVI